MKPYPVRDGHPTPPYDEPYPVDLLWSARRTDTGAYALTVTSGGLSATMFVRTAAAGLELAGALSRFFVAEMEDLGMALQAESEARAVEPE